MDFDSARELLLGFVASVQLHTGYSTAAEVLRIWGDSFLQLALDPGFPSAQGEEDYSLVDGTRYIEHIQTLRRGQPSSYRLPRITQPLLTSAYKLVPDGKYAHLFVQVEDLLTKVDLSDAATFANVLTGHRAVHWAELRALARQLHRESLILSRNRLRGPGVRPCPAIVWRQMVLWYTTNYLAAFLEATADIDLDLERSVREHAGSGCEHATDLEDYLLRLVELRGPVLLPMTIAGMYLVHNLHAQPSPKQSMLLLTTSVCLGPVDAARKREEIEMNEV
jgi:hypothetical protein